MSSPDGATSSIMHSHMADSADGNNDIDLAMDSEDSEEDEIDAYSGRKARATLERVSNLPPLPPYGSPLRIRKTADQIAADHFDDDEPTLKCKPHPDKA